MLRAPYQHLNKLIFSSYTMLESILIILTLFTLTIASYTDLKKREVPDWLSYAFLISALGIRFIFALSSTWAIFVSGLAGFFLFWGIGYLFYKIDQWGGGDAKLLMGLGAVIGLSLPFESNSLLLIWFFLLLLLVGAFYGLCWITVLALKRGKTFLTEFSDNVSHFSSLQKIVIVLTVLLVLLTVYNYLFWPLLLLPLPMFYLFMLVHTVEKSCFYKTLPLSKLTEGDWLAEKIKVGSRIIPEKTLEKADLLLLQKQKKVKSVLIKEGIPFIPGFLLSYLTFLLTTSYWNTIVKIF